MSSSAKLYMLEQMSRYFSLLKSRGTPLLFTQTNITGGQTLTYDVKTMLASHAKYDLRSCDVKVKVLNTTAGDATTNMYIDASAVVSYGIDTNGIVKVNNPGSITMTILITIDYPSVRK